MTDTCQLYLKSKKILFFAPAFFNYEYIIKNELERAGASVVFHDARSVTKSWERAVLKVFPAIFAKKSNNYFERIIDRYKNSDFDYILIIRCDMFSGKILRKLKSAFPNAKLCLYIWDSVINIPNILKKLAFFDFISSFDNKDCLQHNGFFFRPLFYSDDFKRDSSGQTNFSYDISFCGTIHSDRYGIIKKIQKQCNDLGLSFYRFCYLQSKFIYYFYKLVNRDFWNASKSDFSFEKHNQKEISVIADSSRVILDIQHPDQNGLTMRTIEMIGLKKKIITTNADIKNYDFYKPENIFILDRKNPLIDPAFFEMEYVELPEEVYKKYSLGNWILDVLDIKRK